MPTLIQAVASRFRGGVRIVHVVELKEAGECLEVHVSTDASALALLHDNHPSKFVKLCVPKISIVWHPFTVYGNPQDPSTLRFLFRPVGSFTKELRALLTAPQRPVTLIDGFYRGSDHCMQALSHGHVTIVAGGVAITPFLSMINAVLNVLSKSESSTSSNVLKSMTLVWSCRERGLISYIQNTYLEGMARIAKEIHGFNFKVKIYCTGTTEKLTDDRNSSGTDSNPTKDGESSDADNDKKEGSELDGTITKTNANPLSISTGHPMELARMMPARYLRMQWNLPYFIAFSSTIWLSFHIIFSTYKFEEITSLAQMSESTWVLMLTIFFYVAVAFMIEAMCHYGGKYWPAPRPDDFSVVSLAANSARKESDCYSNDNELTDRTVSNNDVSTTFFIENGRRPNGTDIFADACLASAPGIFVCGPNPLVRMVRQEASIENSAFLLTRYVLYEEVFEM